MLVEHATNVLGIVDAAHSEYGGEGSAIVDLLSCSLATTEIEIDVLPDTRLAGIHGPGRHVERTNCNYGLNPAYQHVASEGGLIISAVDDTGEVRAVERPDHPFFVGTLYQPQRHDPETLPHPVFDAFVLAVLAHAGGSIDS